MPPEELHSLLFSIEQAVVAIARKRPRLTDRDAEAVFEQYRSYFRALRQGRELPEPSSAIGYREELLAEIWEVLLLREDRGVDAAVLDAGFAVNGRRVESLEEFYAIGFNELRKSARFWRKREGPKGYLRYVEGQLAEMLGTDQNFFHEPIRPDDGEREAAEPTLRLDWLAREYGIRLTTDPAAAPSPDPRLEAIDRAVEQQDLATARALARTLADERPDYLPGVLNYVGLVTEPTEIVAVSAERLGTTLELTDFPVPSGQPDGPYYLAEFIGHETVVIRLYLARGDYPAAVRRLQRLLDLGLPPFPLQDALMTLALSTQPDNPYFDPPLPVRAPEVEGCAAAVAMVRAMAEVLAESRG